MLDEEVDKQSEMYMSNYDAMQNLNIELEERVASVMRLNGKEQEKLAKRGKKSPRERIDSVVDRGSPFLEIG